MLLCDDEPSPISSDEGFFICEKQGSMDRDETGRENDAEKVDNIGTNEKSDCEETKEKKTASNRLSRMMVDKKSGTEMTIDGEEVRGEKEGLESRSLQGQPITIQIENSDKSIALFPQEITTPTTLSKENKIRGKKKTVAVQVNLNSMESMGDSNCLKLNKLRCSNKSGLLQSSVKMKKPEIASEKPVENKRDSGGSDSTKIYLWSGKNSKKKQQTPLFKSQSVIEKATKTATNQHFTIHEPLQKSNSLIEKTSIKCKKPSIGCSPLKKLNRSSLTIESEKITINLSKYSPCASRLAASSKILSSNSPLSPDSPLQAVRSKSPRRRDVQENGLLDPTRHNEKSTLQASLSLNIQQYRKSHPAPRSRSVGDSCVTSPTSEATTLSYSPTGTEILSLEEVCPQITVNDVNVDDSIMVLQKQEIRDKFSENYIACSRKANLETKC
ncbi:uncharacterized protein [Venturia canescens]|uniref:uncharacterized protein n=1 Tax=Venturia canescens TaxID=32260 RepID=UPI001C9C4533|nr:uncharacterized protein LOC122414311 [Venturia canescens]